VGFVRDRLVDLETADGKIRSAQMESGARFSSGWFIDASGIAASLAAREFNLSCLTLHPLLEPAIPGAVQATSLQCRVYTQSAGPDWLIAGETTSLVDPMTSNGVTAALRHSAEPADLVAGGAQDKGSRVGCTGIFAELRPQENEVQGLSLLCTKASNIDHFRFGPECNLARCPRASILKLNRYSIVCPRNLRLPSVPNADRS